MQNSFFHEPLPFPSAQGENTEQGVSFRLNAVTAKQVLKPHVP